MKPILIVKTGGTFPDMAARLGDFEDWFIARMDRSASAIETVSPFSGGVLPEAAGLGGIIITGSHDMVTDRHPWSEKTAGWLKQAVEADIPVLGVCYGHQLLAHAMGGVVGDNPRGREIGTVTIRLTEPGRQDPLLGGRPETSLPVHACHSQSVLELPAGATLLAASDMDPHHAFAIGRRAWGVQFHPEFDGRILREYIRCLSAELGQQGQDADQLMAGVRETPESEALLRRFQVLSA
ncbi:GMP synthase [Desulfosarcina alkanivorans]|jgi:GMP synthase (glutamine-hydrolysing)|uniref:GMP synthase n=1 Tax=Desulfosarcina alkanivorans TaxID=571177 RepID=A0A5K7YMY4_9BACT|nr:glutamine amidotransferase [Desulfosarcina alkanivorans]BBO67714.1 GMP synthase [Desulfosarcina alkanivorans]